MSPNWYIYTKRLDIKNMKTMETQKSVETIMTTNVRSVDIHEDLYEVKMLMSKYHIRHVPVLCNHKLVGMISQTDILRLSFGNIFESLDDSDSGVYDMFKIEQVMVSHPKVVRNTATIEEVAETFISHDFHALPVVDARENVVGIVSTTDVIKYFLDRSAT